MIFMQTTEHLNVTLNLIKFVVVDLGFTTLLTSQVISVAFYSEREKSDKFCSEAVISACSFTCRKSTLCKNPSTPVGYEPANLGSSVEYDNHGTTGVYSSEELRSTEAVSPRW